jgi:hypothetical protein
MRRAGFGLLFPLLVAVPMLLAAVVAGAGDPVSVELPTVGSIRRLDPRLDQFVAADARIEVLGMGYDWAERSPASTSIRCSFPTSPAIASIAGGPATRWRRFSSRAVSPDRAASPTVKDPTA